jgi:cobalt/nickel transport protein
MKKLLMLAPVVLIVALGVPARAHFQLLIPSKDILEDKGEIEIEAMFTHPAAATHDMDMGKPQEFGVLFKGDKKTDLLETLKPGKFTHPQSAKKDHAGKAYATTYKIKRMGDYVFYLVPAPYWEPAESKYITQCTKVVVDFGLEEGWDAEVGMPAEIMPVSRPYGLYVGNVFQGIVKMNGKPVPHAEIEVEHYNKEGKDKPPAGPYETQIIKADENGMFTYGIPMAGWWGFAALMDGPKIEDKDHELGAVMWIEAAEPK